ncbi:hypothetical protein F2Q70_00010134 [Brassica cretica]|uniref:Uncharacterized protein n=1 Tax=Brassica cretica TaxID=69181 RepID=A0A8S9P0X6_BRACR|nr:hypothetical protein F2Q68_00003140 [Brassica cretica]KAF2615646.1 hypothetical protein F2Q70_00010134 [Brassica cretica]KAF3508355.1 hypothetical protein F2Q69_00003764 [Brassica cretica]
MQTNKSFKETASSEQLSSCKEETKPFVLGEQHVQLQICFSFRIGSIDLLKEDMLQGDPGAKEEGNTLTAMVYMLKSLNTTPDRNPLNINIIKAVETNPSYMLYLLPLSSETSNRVWYVFFTLCNFLFHLL